MIYVTGDIHGNPIERFSFKHHPELRELTEYDYMFILGDCGVPFYNPDLHFYDQWTKPGLEKREHYLLNWLNKKPWTTFFIRGNHDNIDLINEMPWTQKFHANVRQMKYQDKIYNNIFYIDTPQLMYLEGKKILIIPGAESHDVDYLFEYDDPNIKFYIKHLLRKEQTEGIPAYYRINHFSWWENEGVDENKLRKLFQEIPSEVDYIFTHAPCGELRKYWSFPDRPAREKPAPSEQILADLVYNNIKYKLWVHGHFHHHIELSFISSLGIYHEIYSMKELEQVAHNMYLENKYYEEILAAKNKI